MHERAFALAPQRRHLARRQLRLRDLDDLARLRVERQLVGGHVEHRLLIGGDGVAEARQRRDRRRALVCDGAGRMHPRNDIRGDILQRRRRRSSRGSPSSMITDGSHSNQRTRSHHLYSWRWSSD